MILIAVDAPEVTPDWVRQLRLITEAHPGTEQVMLQLPRAHPDGPAPNHGEPLLRLAIECDGCADFMLQLTASLPPSGRVVYD